MANYTIEDEQLIKERYDDLMASCARICRTEADREVINRAFFLAKEAHAGMRRRSGEPYFLHPIAVAQIVVDEIGLGVKSVTAALLHDVVEDTTYTVEEIKSIFGDKIAYMVDGLTKMSGIGADDKNKQDDYFRKVLLTLSDDIRVVLIKIADRLHNMRTLGSMPSNKQVKISSETLFLFAPLAYRLGLYAIKTELEELCFKYLHPEQYEIITQKIQETSAERTKFIEDFCAPIRERLRADGVECTISGRVKSAYSIWSKMERKGITFEEVYDVFAIRVIFTNVIDVPENTRCWQIFSVVTDIYQPKIDRLRNWLTSPKTNGYQALHITVMSQTGTWVEVQIRSERMDEIAERGLAAHWAYKGHIEDDALGKWLTDVRNALNSPDGASDFLDNVKLTLYTSEIVAFTPHGESRKLPLGVTALDFAYDIHTNVGNAAIGAKINHKIGSIFEPIHNGDQVEIITSDNAHPTPEWLTKVKTAKARQAIIGYLKRVRQNNIALGKKTFEERMNEFNITPSARLFRKILPAYECKTKEEFYAKLGAEIITLANIEEVLHSNSRSKILKFWKLQLGNEDNKTLLVGQDSDDGVNGFVIAECCKPIPGDKIVGIRDAVNSNVITVHKVGCEVFTRLATSKGSSVIADKELKWASYKAESYLAELELRGIDRVGILMDLAQIISGGLNINIRKLSIQSHDGIFEGSLHVYVKDTQNLDALLAQVSEIKGIESVRRIS